MPSDTEDVPGADAQHATGVTEGVLRALLGSLSTPPHLSSSEANLSLTATKRDDQFRVDCEIKSVSKRLLLHPRFEVREIRVSDESTDGRFGLTVAPREWDETGCITGVRGTLPVGAVNIPPTGSSRNQWSGLVSDRVLDNDPRGGDSE